jgi:hypothetical protein
MVKAADKIIVLKNLRELQEDTKNAEKSEKYYTKLSLIEIETIQKRPNTNWKGKYNECKYQEHT